MQRLMSHGSDMTETAQSINRRGVQAMGWHLCITIRPYMHNMETNKSQCAQQLGHLCTKWRQIKAHVHNKWATGMLKMETNTSQCAQWLRFLFWVGEPLWKLQKIHSIQNCTFPSRCRTFGESVWRCKVQGPLFEIQLSKLMTFSFIAFRSCHLCWCVSFVKQISVNLRLNHVQRLWWFRAPQPIQAKFQIKWKSTNPSQV